MSKLDELLVELDKRRSEHRTASYFSITHTEYDLLRSALRDGDRYRYARDNLFIGTVYQSDVDPWDDAAIDAAMKEASRGN